MPAHIYEPCQEMKEIIKDLFEKRKDLFGDMIEFIFPEMISCAIRTDKPSPPSKTEVLNIKGIKGPYTTVTDKKYIIYGYRDAWERCSYEKKVAHVANMLRRIEYPTQEEINELSEKGKDYEYGKTKTPDIHDFKTFIDAFGSDWSSVDKDTIPNLLDNTDIII